MYIENDCTFFVLIAIMVALGILFKLFPKFGDFCEHPWSFTKRVIKNKMKGKRNHV